MPKIREKSSRQPRPPLHALYSRHTSAKIVSSARSHYPFCPLLLLCLDLFDQHALLRFQRDKRKSRVKWQPDFRLVKVVFVVVNRQHRVHNQTVVPVVSVVVKTKAQKFYWRASPPVCYVNVCIWFPSHFPQKIFANIEIIVILQTETKLFGFFP